MQFEFISVALLVYAAFGFYVLGFLVRDELVLRVFVFLGSFFYILYYFFVDDLPLWEAIITSSIIGLTNMGMILVILRERSTYGMSADHRALFDAFPTLNPGQFRRILKLANWRVASGDEQICKTGEQPVALYFIRSGEATMSRGGHSYPIGALNFVGELSFLLDQGASADVVVHPGTEYVAWDRVALKALLSRKPALSNAVAAMFNRDIAAKLRASAPDAAYHTSSEIPA